MTKLIGILALVVIAFLTTLLGSMAATGNLNKEALLRLMGREEAPSSAPEEKDPLGPAARRIETERQRLIDWEAKLTEHDDRLRQRQQVLDETLSQVQEIQDQLAENLDDMDAEHTQRIKDTAKLVAAMKAQSAAKSLEELPPEDAAEILRNIKDRTAGRILDAMEPRRRTQLLQIIQERKY